MTRTMRLIAVPLVMLLVGCSGRGPTPAAVVPTASATPEAPVPPDQVAIFRAWMTAMNEARWSDVAAALGDDVTLVPASSGMKLEGKDNVVEFFKSFAVGFPDLRSAARVILSRPGHVVALARSTGTNSAAVGPFPATNRQISFLGLTHVELDAAGAITAVTAYADNLNFMGQMGQWDGAARETDTTDDAPPTTATEQRTPIEAANQALVGKLVAAFNRHDAPALLGMYAPDAVLDDQHLGGPIITAGQIAAHYSALFPSFPDIGMADVATWAAGDYVVIEYALRGTHAGPYARLPGAASYRQIDLQVAALVKLRDGKIAEHGIFVDGMAMGFQLGVLALPSAEPTPTP
jgi:steroid delta-isomerase-like uncharacterized protein